MNLIDKDTNKDAIIAYLRSGDEGADILTTKQQSLLKFYTRAYDLVRAYNSTPDVIKVLVKLSVELGEPISQSTARRYVYDAQDVFGYVSKTKAEAITHLCTEVLKDALAMAWRANDHDGMVKAAKELHAIAGKESEQPFNPEMLEQHVIEIGLDPEALKLVQHVTARGPVDLDTLMGNMMNHAAEDANIIQDGQ